MVVRIAARIRTSVQKDFVVANPLLIQHLYVCLQSPSLDNGTSCRFDGWLPPKKLCANSVTSSEVTNKQLDVTVFFFYGLSQAISASRGFAMKKKKKTPDE